MGHQQRVHRRGPVPTRCLSPFSVAARMQTSPRDAPSPVNPDLLALVAKGDQEAFRKLYDWSSSLLFTLALKILGDLEEAADLLQEVYLEVWRKTVRYDAWRGAPMPWLVTLTRSRAIDRLRARAAENVQGSRFEVQRSILQPPAPNFELRTEPQKDLELRTVVTKALAELPENQQQALTLAYYEGLSHTEIAARLNQPVGTIKTRITLGMSTLHTALRPCWDQE